MKVNNSSFGRKKTIAVTVSLIIILLLGGGLYYYTTSRDSVANQPASQESDEVNKINYNPPTDQEKKSGDEKKKDITKEQESPRELPNTATVAITDASQYGEVIEVRAFVSNVVKNGTCEIRFTYQSFNVTKSVPANADAHSTPCMTLTVPRSEFQTPGEWSVKVTYKNDQVMGSASSKIKVE